MHIKIEKDSYYAIVHHNLMAMQGEADTRTVSIDYPAVSGAEGYYLRFALPEQIVYDLPIADNQVLLPASVTASAGTVQVQWIARSNDGTVIAKSQMIPAVVKASIDGDVSALPTPEEMQNKYEEYIGTMTEVRDTVVSTGEQVAADAAHTEEIVTGADTLLEELRNYTTGSRIRVYVDGELGDDNNDGMQPGTGHALKTLDKALSFTAAYRKVHISMQAGQTYTAQTTTNEYGTAAFLYAKNVSLEKYGVGESPVIDTAITAIGGTISAILVDLKAVTLRQAFGLFDNTDIDTLTCKNSIAYVRSSTINNTTTSGGCTSLANVTVSNTVAATNAGVVFCDLETTAMEWLQGGSHVGIIFHAGYSEDVRAALTTIRNEIAGKADAGTVTPIKNIVDNFGGFVPGTGGSWSNACTTYYTNINGVYTFVAVPTVSGTASNALSLIPTGLYVPNLQPQIDALTASITVYVDAASGIDSDDGSTADTAFATLEAAITATRQYRETTINLAAGTYTLPGKLWTSKGVNVILKGASAATTIIKGNISIDGCGFFHAADVTIDSTDSTAANTSSPCLTMRYGSSARFRNVDFVSAATSCVTLKSGSSAAMAYCTFSGATSKAILLTESPVLKLYQCTDNTGYGVTIPAGCIAYISNSDWNYTASGSGMVYIDGQQVAPQTAETAAVLSMGGNV